MILRTLISIANRLDEKGLHKKADELDHVIQIIAFGDHEYRLNQALQEDDPTNAKMALDELLFSTSPGTDPSHALNLTDKQFKSLVEAINSGDLETARQLLIY